MASTSFTIEGDVTLEITVTEMGDGTLKFDIVTLSEDYIGDLRGIFFDLGDDSLTDGLTITGEDVTATAYKVDGVTRTSKDNNVNGEVVNEDGKFDVGVEFGTSGMAGDDIQSTSFILSHETEALTLDAILSQDFAIRLTSVGEVDGSRDDSLKLNADAPDTYEEDPGPDVVFVEDEPVDDDPVVDDPYGEDPTDTGGDLPPDDPFGGFLG